MCGMHARSCVCFHFRGPSPTAIHTLSLHDALPISPAAAGRLVQVTLRAEAPLKGGRALLVIKKAQAVGPVHAVTPPESARSEEHTSELQSHSDIVCRLLLEKKKRRRPSHTWYAIDR